MTTDQLKPISILHLSDPHILTTSENSLFNVDTADSLNIVLTLALKSNQPYDLCLLTGDLVHQPSADSYQNVRSILQRYPLKVVCLPGNHDNAALMQKHLNTANISCAKQSMLGNWQVICLNSAKAGTDVGYLNPEELAFLDCQLSKHSELFALIAVHHHCIPVQSDWLDTMMIANSADLLTLIGRYPNVKLLINGHIHQEAANTIQHATLLSTPSTCFQFKPFSTKFSLDTQSPGYRRIELYADGNHSSRVYRLSEPLPGLTDK